jgi:ketosteroid isomerase-like protein
VRPVTTTIEERIAELERNCAAAIMRGDHSSCDTVLSDDYTVLEVIEDRPLQLVLRDAWLDQTKATPLKRLEVDDVAVSVHGNIAVAVVKLTEDTGDGSDQIAVTDIWRKDDDWRLIERHQSRPLTRPE